MLRQKVEDLVVLEVLLVGGELGWEMGGWGKVERDVKGTCFNLKEQNCWFIICHTISSEAMVKMGELVGDGGDWDLSTTILELKSFISFGWEKGFGRFREL